MIRYAITDPVYYGHSPESLEKSLKKVLAKGGIDRICLRDKTTDEYDMLARAFLSLKPFYPHIAFYLHGSIDSALDLGADGLHLPSHRLEEIREAAEAGLAVTASTHTLEEALAAQRAGAEAITFSPIFETPGKGPAVGLEKLKEIRDKISIKIIALGGIVTPEQIDAVCRAGADGFASIRYFAPKENH